MQYLASPSISKEDFVRELIGRGGLFGITDDPVERRRRSGRVTRLLRLFADSAVSIQAGVPCVVESFQNPQFHIRTPLSHTQNPQLE